ncbi:AMP-binding protein [Spirillospora sp. NPDC047279]|uniref:class I adenylate-forming enzyme family protein n=1 Tax=Spirillospora sp. NPDC047279 TaxID=3155478 RepID=UPI0033F5DAE6
MSGSAVPLFPCAVLDLLRSSPEGVAFEQGERRVSRGELLEMIGRLAGALRAAGLGPGSGLAIRTAVSPEAFAAHIAAHVLGCRVVGVRPGYPAAQLVHVLGMGVDAILADGSADLMGRRVLRLERLLDSGAPPVLDVASRPGDVAMLTFTSGSTGRPKGCAITYRALSEHWSWQPALWSPPAREMAAGFGRYLLFGTLASMVVLEFLALCLLGGGTAVIPEEDGDRPLFPYGIERHRITGSIITVPRLTRMLDVLRDEPVDVGRLRALMVSGSPLSPDRLAAAVERLGPVVYHGYGQTEAGSISILTPGEIARGPAHVLESVGRPHPRVEIGIRDGEIRVRSPYQMSGYWGDDEETRATLRDGWLLTRDLGRVDEDGLLYLSGRARDVVMVNAMVVYAGPIERVLASHPGVVEAYVAGAPDEETGEAVHAFVVPADGGLPDAGELRDLVRAELGGDSVPRTVTAVSGVPMAATGKPDKAALLSDRSLRIRREH